MGFRVGRKDGSRVRPAGLPGHARGLTRLTGGPVMLCSVFYIGRPRDDPNRNIYSRSMASLSDAADLSPMPLPETGQRFP